jgi:hypothetical protein
MLGGHVRVNVEEIELIRLGVETVLRTVAPPSSASSRNFANLLGMPNSTD